MDRLLLEGMVFFGRHGHKEAERELGQHFRVDVELVTDVSEAGHSDDLEHTENYPDAYRAAREIVEGEPCNLLETVAERVAERMLRFDRVDATTVRIRKRPPVEGEFESFGVEVIRVRA